MARDESSPKVALIHVGMHKTGTTSLQVQCGEAAEELRARGLLYPKSGREGSSAGHWQFAQEMFEASHRWPTSGVVAEMLAEISEADCPRVLISCEDLSLMWNNRSPLDCLRSALEDLGYEVHVLICRRELESMLPALYGTLVVLAIDMPRTEFERQARETGQVVVPARPYHPSKTYCLEPDRLIEAFGEVFGRERVHVVEYAKEGMIGRVMGTQAWFFGDEASLFSDEQRENASSGDKRRRELEDQLVALRSSLVWRSTNWMRSPAAHKVRRGVGRVRSRARLLFR